MKKINIEVEALGAELNEKENRKIQISVKQLINLTLDGQLCKDFIEVINNSPGIKANMAYEIANAIGRQRINEKMWEEQNGYAKHDMGEAIN